MHILATVSSKAISSLNGETAVVKDFFFPNQNSFYLILLHRGILMSCLLFPKHYLDPAVKHGCRNVTELNAAAGTGARTLPCQKCRCKILLLQHHYKVTRLLPPPCQAPRMAQGLQAECPPATPAHRLEEQRDISAFFHLTLGLHK